MPTESGCLFEIEAEKHELPVRKGGKWDRRIRIPVSDSPCGVVRKKGPFERDSVCSAGDGCAILIFTISGMI